MMTGCGPVSAASMSVLGSVGTGWNDVFAHPFMRHAYLAGVPIAALCGLVGAFLVLRAQVFAADALSHVAFAGAVGALAVGLDARVGLFVATALVAVVLGLTGERAAPTDVEIGAVFAWVLGIGVLALSRYTLSRSGGGPAGARVLFGSIFGLDINTSRTAAAIAAGLLVVLCALARPLLFASVDADVAAVRGVPVRILGMGFLLVVAATAAEATQAIGSLLLIGLVAAPAGAASRLTDRPYRAMAISVVLAVAATVVGLYLSYLVGDLPPSFAIVACAAGELVAAIAVERWRRRVRIDHVRIAV